MDSESQETANIPSDKVIVQAELVPPNLAHGDECTPLQPGAFICGRRYRLIHLLHKRPRIHLYLAQRLVDPARSLASELPLVVVRELVLSGLDIALRQDILHAALEEFAAPLLFGSPHLAGVGDRLQIEHERHYLVMQPRSVAGDQPDFAVPLSELLAGQGHGPDWLDVSIALNWGIQLCQVVERLQRHSVLLLGELTPDMLLVGRDGDADWIPILLPCWPPPAPFWPPHTRQKPQHLLAQIFPLFAAGEPLTQDLKLAWSREHPFAAPETLAGEESARATVYTLGAMLYLLLTRHTPATTSQPLHTGQTDLNKRPQTRRSGRQQGRVDKAESKQQPALIAPRLLNEALSPALEAILLRALAFDPQQRFASLQELTEALAGIVLTGKALPPPAQTSRLKRLLHWFNNKAPEN